MPDVFTDDVPEDLSGAAKAGITPVPITVKGTADTDVPHTRTGSLSELLI